MKVATHVTNPAGRDPVTGEWKKPEPKRREGVVYLKDALRVAKAHGWTEPTVEKGEFGALDTALFLRSGSKGVSIGLINDEVVTCNASMAERVLLILSDSCTCEGEPRTGPCNIYDEEVNDPDCPAHWDEVVA